jgi:signal transduction histidine kinase
VRQISGISGARAEAPTRPVAVDIALAAVVAVLVLSMAAVIAVPALEIWIVAPDLDLVLDTVTTLVALSVAALSWVDYRQRGGSVALFQAAAFLVLGIANGLGVALVVGGLGAGAGMALSAPGQAPLYVFTAARLIAAALLIVGGLCSLGDRRPGRPRTVVVGSAIAMVAVIALIEARSGSLPSLRSAVALGSLPASTVLGAAVQVIVAALFLWAAALSRRLYRRDGSVGLAFLAVGLAIAAFAQAQAAINPGTYAGLVTSSDVLRLAFDMTLLTGILAMEGATLAGLRAANADSERLRTLDVQRAALDERAHLSRELHDGLAQNLWVAKLKAGRLATLPDLGQEADALVGELKDAIDAGLAEAQQAVTALRVSGEPAGPLWEVIARYVDDFADRFGLRAEVECPSGRSGLAPRAEAELLRIAQEALTNVHRHADATVVRVRAAVEDGRLELLVGDNGRGFDPDTVGAGSYGLASMRERAALIGGELKVDSRPRDGTRIRVLVPLPQAAPAGAGAR